MAQAVALVARVRSAVPRRRGARDHDPGRELTARRESIERYAPRRRPAAGLQRLGATTLDLGPPPAS